jgi:hypothetical protein
MIDSERQKESTQRHDGEVLHLEPDSGISIDCASHILTTVGWTTTVQVEN